MNKDAGTLKEKKIIQERLLEGALRRAIFLTLVFTAIFAAYGFTSIKFIQKFDPTVTLIQNIWPRIVFNVLPMLLIFLFLKSKLVSTKAKVYSWAVLVPVIFMAACLVNVWRIMSDIDPGIYLYVQSANTFMFVSTIIVLSPPPRILFVMVASYLIFLFAPLGFILLSRNRFDLFEFGANEYAIGFPFVFVVGHMIHKLRYRVAELNLQIKKQAKSFLGSHVTDAIYSHKTNELFQSRQVNAAVMQLDLRGFTDFYKKTDQLVVRKFMTEYHSLVSREIGRFNGYWHKSVGDAHIVTFGAIKSELMDASKLDRNGEENQRKLQYYKDAFSAFNSISYEFEKLKEKHGIDVPISIGAGLAYGNLEVRIQGDSAFKQELDIDGESIIRCARLEEYTKKIRNDLGTTDSTICISPEFCSHSKIEGITEWLISSPDRSVRNYPDIKNIYYYRYVAAANNVLKTA